jgi:nitrile hydratase subunit beta
MNGVHDMGGMHGFGPLDLSEHGQAPFHAEWEKHVRALQDTTEDRYYNLDAFRYGIEQMDPADYLRSGYYERWLATVTTNMLASGLITADELDAKTAYFLEHPEAEVPREATNPVISAPKPVYWPVPPEQTPRFGLGDAVVTRNEHPVGHTRLPRYARGKRGVIARVHGTYVFADTNAMGLGEHPQVVYAVQFDGGELWGESAEPGTTVSIDLWESYLEPASVQISSTAIP